MDSFFLSKSKDTRNIWNSKDEVIQAEVKTKKGRHCMIIIHCFMCKKQFFFRLKKFLPILHETCIFEPSFKNNNKMKNSIIFIAFAALMALSGCIQNRGEGKLLSFDWNNNDKIEYAIDYKVCFSADHDSTIQVSATCNYGTAKVVQVESENLIGEDGKLVKNTFIILEDCVPTDKNLTLNRGGLSYSGGKPEFVHNRTVGSDDLVDIRILGSDDYTLYSIRDNMFFGPNYDEESFTIGGGQRFSIALPVVTEEMYPKEKESHTVRIVFGIL